MIGATSPAPRPTARIAPVITPGNASGSTIFQIVINFVAPSARLPSRSPFGTAFSASSVATIMTGNVITAIVAAAQISAGFR